MAKTQDRLWMVLCGYVLASTVLLFVYENYVRTYVIGVGIPYSPPSTVQRGAHFPQGQVDPVPSAEENDEHKSKLISRNDDEGDWANSGRKFPNSDRLHSCLLPGNETLHTMQAPDVVIAGAQKGGTSAFYFILKQHPNLSPSMKFESHFFDWHFAVPPKDLGNSDFLSKWNATNEDELLCAARKQYIDANFNVEKLLRSSKRKITYEKTPNYMFLPQVPELIYKVCPWHPKIIIILRNPTDRAYSHFVMDSSKTRVDQSFETYIELEMETMRKVGLTNIPNLPASEWGSLNNTSMDKFFYDLPNHMTVEEADHSHWMVYRTRHMRNYLQRGIYGVQLERWMKFFPLNEKLLIINNERFHREPRTVMGEVLHFLGAPQPEYFANEEVSVSFTEKGAGRSNTKVSGILSVGGYAPMKNETRLFLEKFYKPYNDQIADLLGEEWRNVWDYDLSVTTERT